MSGARDEIIIVWEMATRKRVLVSFNKYDFSIRNVVFATVLMIVIRWQDVMPYAMSLDYNSLPSPSNQ